MITHCHCHNWVWKQHYDIRVAVDLSNCSEIYLMRISLHLRDDWWWQDWIVNIGIRHPAGRPLTSDWYVNIVVIVVYEKKFWSCFEQKILTGLLKKVLIDNHYKKSYGPVRRECFPVGCTRVCSLRFPLKYHMARGLIELGVFLIFFWAFCFPLSEEPFCWNTPRSAKVFKFYGRWLSQEDQHQWRIYIVKFWTRPPSPGSKFFRFHAVFGEISQNRMFAPPPPREGWRWGYFGIWVNEFPMHLSKSTDVIWSDTTVVEFCLKVMKISFLGKVSSHRQECIQRRNRLFWSYVWVDHIPIVCVCAPMMFT